jgi:hypothetical protein
MKKIILTISLCCLTAASFGAQTNFSGTWSGKVTVLVDNGKAVSNKTVTLKQIGPNTYRGTDTWARISFTCLKSALHCNQKIEQRRAGSNSIIATKKVDGTLAIVKNGEPGRIVVMTPTTKKGKVTMDFFLEGTSKPVLIRGNLAQGK